MKSKRAIVWGAACATVGASVPLAGCAHSMQVKNLHAYNATAPSTDKSLRFLVKNDSARGDEQDLYHVVADSLAKESAVARVVRNTGPPDFQPDYVATITPHTTYHGSGWNYLITFPGFLLFTHAWNGFVYQADVVTDVSLQPAGGGAPVTARLETRYDLRHCDLQRGAWTSSGWYLPGLGASNLIVGFFMIGYDEDATPEFVRVVSGAYGKYVADTIVAMAAKQAGVPLAAADLPRVDRCATFSPASQRFEEACT